MIPVTATLIIGVLIGYLGQRSRFCTISGIRDLFLLKDSYRVKGLLGIIIGAVLAFIVFKSIGGEVAGFPAPIQIESAGYLTISIIGGVGIGFFSILAEGCPFRQHVMAAEGKQSAMFYLMGFYVGIVYFSIVTTKFVELLIMAMS
ncbi:MAG: YeeE/YedE thiosulfate transporter family protein [Candidatus Thorarchaeota archaeon]|jgi:uncharacterized membrane protein YedE/YeeE